MYTPQTRCDVYIYRKVSVGFGLKCLTFCTQCVNHTLQNTGQPKDGVCGKQSKRNRRLKYNAIKEALGRLVKYEAIKMAKRLKYEAIKMAKRLKYEAIKMAKPLRKYEALKMAKSSQILR